MLHGTIRNDDFKAQHSVATLLRHCFEWLQHCSSIATLCCAKHRRCESFRVTSPLQPIVVIAYLRGSGLIIVDWQN